MSTTFRLEVANLRPERASVFVTLRGRPSQMIASASAVVRGLAARYGVSPLALDWEVTAAQGAQA